MASNRDRMTIHIWEEISILDFGEMEIWDGADLALIRDTLSRMTDIERRPAIGFNMKNIKYIPSGFFGMLYDCLEKGTDVFLLAPQPHVKSMLWFRTFFINVSEDSYQLVHEDESQTPAAAKLDWSTVPIWNDEEEQSFDFDFKTWSYA